MIRIVHKMRGDSYDRYVGRPTKWGNPYPLSLFTLQESLDKFELYLRETPFLLDAAKRELVGADLACWCAPKGGVGIDDKLICHAQLLARAARGDYD